MYDQIREDTFYIMLYAVAIIVLLVMLQDRRRPLWPAFLVMTPLVAGSVWCVANRSNASLSAFYAYMLVLCVGIVTPAVATPEQLKGFPQTFLIVGTLDLFVHEDQAFVEQLKKTGVNVDSFVETGVPHSYDVMLNDSPQTIRFKKLRDDHVKQMFESEL